MTKPSGDEAQPGPFAKRREKIFQNALPLLADPVAHLLAAAYEPRVDTEYTNGPFDHLVKREQQHLSSLLTDMTADQGGQVESMAIESAKRLLVAADRAELTEAAQILRSAIERSSGHSPTSPSHDITVPEPERVHGSDGRPLGLWR